MFGNHHVDTKLKYRKRDNVYRNSTENCIYYVDSEIAKSYGWWTFVKRIDAKLVFNSYHYSNSTANHQRAVKDLLKRLKLKIDLEVSTRSSLSDKSSLSESLKKVYEEMFIAQHKIDTQFMGKKVRENREYEVKRAKEKIKMYKSIGVKTNEPLEEIMMDAIANYEHEAARTREQNRQERQAKQKINPKLKETLNSLKPLEYGKVFEQFNDVSQGV
jgi:hypothetical protein